MGDYDWKIIKSALESNKESQQEKFPYLIDPKKVFGLKIQVNKNVYSPKYAGGYKFFIPLLPDPTGKKVLEIGCGHGLISCYLAKKAKHILSVDINPNSVENTKINAKHNKLNNIEARQSNVFSNIKENEKFDIIFWNTPWAKVPKKFEKNMSILDYSTFDPEYKAISKFILQGKDHLTKTGSLYLGFGVEGADIKLIENLIKKAGLRKEVVGEEYKNLGEKVEGKPFKFHIKLYKLKCKNKS